MAKEKAKRLTPKGDVLRELFLKSGNLCAFPGCSALMMDADGDFIGKVCHIEAAEEKGERFNPLMTNETRRSVSNLVLLCDPHHTKTNNVRKYPVATMQRMKADHEKKFASPERALLQSLTDKTTSIVPTKPKNLGAVQSWAGVKFDTKQLARELRQYELFIEELRDMPIEVRKFLSVVSTRLARMDERSQNVETLRRAIGFGQRKVQDFERMSGSFVSIDEGREKNEWNFCILSDCLWEIALFSKDRSVNIESFLIDLKFEQLDS